MAFLSGCEGTFQDSAYHRGCLDLKAIFQLRDFLKDLLILLNIVAYPLAGSQVCVEQPLPGGSPFFFETLAPSRIPPALCQGFDFVVQALDNLDILLSPTFDIPALGINPFEYFTHFGLVCADFCKDVGPGGYFAGRGGLPGLGCGRTTGRER